VERLPTISEGAGGLAALPWDTTGLLALSSWAAGLPSLSGGEAELPARVVTIKNPSRGCG